MTRPPQLPAPRSAIDALGLRAVTPEQATAIAANIALLDHHWRVVRGANGDGK